MQGPVRVLVCDDDEVSYYLVERLLSQSRLQRFTVEWSATYDKARARLLAREHDVCLLDFRLSSGGATGLDLLVEAREAGVTEPIIMLTGQGGYDVDVEAMRAGASDYLDKADLTAAILERSIRYALERERERRALHDAERRLAEADRARLYEQEREYLFLVNAVPEQLWYATADGRPHLQNRAMLEYLGVEDIDSATFDWTQTIHPDDRDEFFARWLRALETGEGYETEFRHRRADGEYRWHLTHVIPLRDEEGRITKWFGSNTDIHDYKMAVENLERSEREYRGLFEQANDAILILDAESERVLDVNERACQLYGFSCDELVGLPASALAKDAGAFRTFVAETLEGEAPNRVDAVHVRKDGAQMHLEMQASAIAYQGRPAVLSINRDVTARRRLEEQFLQAQKMEAVGRLAGGVAHDFNNLLTVIGGYSELIRSRLKPGDPLHSDVDEIRQASARAAALTEQLLAFSRKQVLRPQPLDLGEVVSRLARMLERVIGEDVHLVLDLDAEPVRTVADPHQVEQALLNLAVNARDAMPDGGTLTIQTCTRDLSEPLPRAGFEIAPGRYAVLTVADTGTGMDEGTLSHLFEPFFTTKEQGKGTGLGLSTVYGIVKQSDGYLDVSTAVGEGTTFTIYLPRIEEPAREKREEEVAHRSSGAETVLLVEDESGVRHLVSRMLRSSGYTVLEASDGAEALDLCRTHDGPIDLLLTDVVMPKMYGQELARQVRELLPGLKVLYMSGYSEDLVAARGAFEEGSSYIAKPFRPDDLLRSVRDALD
jgi:two-component system cell cycle sensor histidine kinase/response regulator CckA